MPDSGPFTREGRSVEYIYDAFKERLPSNWSLSRAEAPSMAGDAIGAFYQWHDWTTGNICKIEVHEHFADKIGVDALCDFVMLQVEEAMKDPLAKFTSPKWKRGEASIPRDVLLHMAEEWQRRVDAENLIDHEHEAWKQNAS